MEDINKRLDSLEAKVDKLIPVIDLLDTIIRANIDKTDTLNDAKPKEFDPKGRELVYMLRDNNVYIYGTKTFQCRDIIKSTFKEATWCKDKSSWTFQNFDNFEQILFNIFPNIIKENQ